MRESIPTSTIDIDGLDSPTQVVSNISNCSSNQRLTAAYFPEIQANDRLRRSMDERVGSSFHTLTSIFEENIHRQDTEPS